MKMSKIKLIQLIKESLQEIGQPQPKVLDQLKANNPEEYKKIMNAFQSLLDAGAEFKNDPTTGEIVISTKISPKAKQLGLAESGYDDFYKDVPPSASQLAKIAREVAIFNYKQADMADDKEVKALFKSDAKDALALAKLLDKKLLVQASKFFSSLDTGARDVYQEKLYRALQNRNLLERKTK